MTYFNPPSIRGFPMWDLVSAFQKAVRRGDEPAALTWAVELDQSGWANLLWQRITVITSEDIGPAEPTLPATIGALHASWGAAQPKQARGKHTARLFLLHAVLLLVHARKSRIVDLAAHATYGCAAPLVDTIPDYAYDKHTARGRRNGADMAHFLAEGARVDNVDFDYDRPEYAERQLQLENPDWWAQQAGKAATSSAPVGGTPEDAADESGRLL